MSEGFYYLPSLLPTTPDPGAEPEPWTKTDVVGKPIARVDGYERVSGGAEYPSDVRLPEMLHGAVLRSPYPHARVKSVDATRAEQMPGVVAVLTGDEDDARIPWIETDDGTVRNWLFEREVRYEGEAIAAVAAETPYEARDALRAIEVDYEVLPSLSDYRRALDDDAPEVHEGGNRATEPQKSERGDVEQGFADADVVLEREYSTACEIHTPLELHGCVARWDGPRLTVWESTQGVYSVQDRLADLLHLSRANVRVIGHYVGGGFGAKLWPGKYSVIAALLARRAARPVKLFLSREETMLAVGNRPANQMRLKAGVTDDGKLTALEFHGLGAGGAYSQGGTGILDWQIRDLYQCDNVRTETENVYVHAGDERPFRAPGHPQCSWALEQMMDELAHEIGMDPVELRLQNLTDVSQARGGMPYTSTGLRECLENGAEEFGWQEAKHETKDDDVARGVGMASCLWIAGSGGPPSTVVVKLFADGSANLNMGASDIGTGTKTVMAMVVSEELGVPLEKISIEHADTGTTQYATASGGSKTVPTEAPAVRDAALACKRQVLEMAADQMNAEQKNDGAPDDQPVVAAADLDLDGGRVTAPGGRVLEITEIPTFRRRRVVMGVGYRGPNPETKAISPFAAQFCEVEVDRRTGEVRILRFLGANESGRVMSRKTYDSQVYGGIVMGIGLGMTERRVLDAGQTGKNVSLSWHDYKIPTAKDAPAEMVSLPIELDDDECNNTGAKGLGEPVTIPTAPAIANAVYDAVGVRIRHTPVNPTRLAEALHEKNTTHETQMETS